MSSKPRACKCGARTQQVHLQNVLDGYPVHTFGGPQTKLPVPPGGGK